MVQHFAGIRDVKTKKEIGHRSLDLDIISWTQCFLVYIAIMHQKFPDMVPKKIAYMLTILRAQQEFEDPGWRIYDHNY